MQNYPIASKMSIHEKINFRDNAIFHLTVEQFFQLARLQKMILAPYYLDRLIAQSKQVEENENFKSIYGKYRWEYENGI